MKKVWIIIALVVVIGAIVAANLLQEEEGQEVTAEKVEKGTVIQKVTGSGQIKPAVEVSVSANVSGRIVALHVEEGDRVKKGQLLVELEREQYEASVQRAESSLLSAVAREKRAKSELTRGRELHEQNLMSDAEFEALEATFLEAEAARMQAEASRDEALDQLRKTRLYADMDGVVTNLSKEQGEIAIGATFTEDLIMTISDLSVMEAVIEVDENEVVSIAEMDSAAVEVDAFPDTLFWGDVTEIANSAITKGLGTQEQVTNFEITITLRNPNAKFRPGMSTTVDIYTDRNDDVLRVPIQSVTVREKKRLEKKGDVEDQPAEEETVKEAADENVEVVFVVEEGKAVAKPVKLGISDDTHFAVLSGVNEGDEVITGPFKLLSRSLSNEDKVKVKKDNRYANKD